MDFMTAYEACKNGRVVFDSEGRPCILTYVEGGGTIRGEGIATAFRLSSELGEDMRIEDLHATNPKR